MYDFEFPVHTCSTQTILAYFFYIFSTWLQSSHERKYLKVFDCITQTPLWNTNTCTIMLFAYPFICYIGLETCIVVTSMVDKSAKVQIDLVAFRFPVGQQRRTRRQSYICTSVLLICSELVLPNQFHCVSHAQNPGILADGFLNL